MSITIPYASQNFDNSIQPADMSNLAGNNGITSFITGYGGTGKGIQFAAAGDGGTAGLQGVSIALTNAQGAGAPLTIPFKFNPVAEVGSGERTFLHIGVGAAINCTVALDQAISTKYRAVIIANNVKTYTNYIFDLGTWYVLQYEWLGGTGTSGMHRLKSGGTTVAENLAANTINQGNTNQIRLQAACAMTDTALLTLAFDDFEITAANGFATGNPYYFFAKKKVA